MSTGNNPFDSVLSASNLLKLTTSKDLIQLAGQIASSDFVSHSRDWTTIRTKYLCQALIQLAKLDGTKTFVKSRGHSVFQIDYDFIQDCIPYIVNLEDPQDLTAEYPAEAVFRVRMIWNTLNSKTLVFNENNKAYTDFVKNFKPLQLFKDIFTGTSVDVIADSDEEEFIGWLSICEVENRAKDITAAIYSVIPENLKKIAVEDIFIKQIPVLEDSRIEVEARLELATIQMLAYDNDLAHELQVGWSNAINGVMPISIETIST